ncbi:MAG: hypothetical protein DI565_07425 [Ancylobacter novellus]|uniref:DUF805 domain-containing protein n=1 Tax=Ancylobacter novellus TaxID=921 RepID=A0A2W5MHZ6_ANCNO|nr:MAG: hypothetical protein DI565_07425 [Ancylobacter novellus]
MLATIAEDYFSWRGRIRRRSYWLRSLAAALAIGVIGGLGGLARPVSEPAAVALWGLAILLGAWVCASLVVRRFHDHGRDGRLGFACLAAASALGGLGHWIGAPPPATILASAVGLALSAYVGFAPGVRGPNRYGPDPAAD